VIGWYIHHVGRGHLHRAAAVSRRLGRPVTGLSSLPRPDGWDGPWLQLERDDATSQDVTAGGQLHWAPVQDDGLRHRMAALSSWIQRWRPRAVVSDVSAEVALLARLHGVPVVSVVLPGDRSDPAHILGYRVSSALVATWPAGASDVVRGLPQDVRVRIRHIGALSRLDVSLPRSPRTNPSRVTVLLGAGGTAVTPARLRAAQHETPGWRWQVLGPPPLGVWVTDPSIALAEADVVVTHGGQNAIAEVAAVRRPAIVVPEQRPHAEQVSTARSLSQGRWPVTVLSSWPDRGWQGLLAESSKLAGALWEPWCDGHEADRFAEIIERTATSAVPRRVSA
jgi:hypothetical protein